MRTPLLLAGAMIFVWGSRAVPACQSLEARQFAFWLGTWDLTGRARVKLGSDQWNETRSVNTIRSTMDGCVTREEFANLTPDRWTGMSVSVWIPQSREWHQTWVDSQGGYISLAGGFRDGKMILVTSPHPLPSGVTVVNRMVFHDIARDSLVWDWEASRDKGRAWELLWSITYRRRK